MRALLVCIFVLQMAGGDCDLLAEPGNGAQASPAPEPQLVILAVDLNGQRVSDGAFCRRTATGGLLLQRRDLAAWRLDLDGVETVTVEGEEYVLLQTLPGAEIQVDETRLHLDLRLPAGRFAATERNGRARPAGRSRPVSAASGYLNYELGMDAGQGRSAGASGTFQLHLSDPGRAGSLDANLFYTDDGRLLRRDTSWSRDFLALRHTLTAGDTATAGGSLGRPVPIAGVRWSSDHSLDPDLVTTPGIGFAGQLTEPSDVEVSIDGLRVWSDHLPPGPFAVRDLHGPSFAGEAQLAVREPGGSLRVLARRRFLLNPQLLAAGISELSLAGGFQRLAGHRLGASYDARPVVTGSLRRGVTDRFTAEVYGEAREDLQVAGGGLACSLPAGSLLAASLTASRQPGLAGGRADLRWELRRRRFGAQLATELLTGGFRQLADEGRERALRRLDALDLSLDLPGSGAVALRVTHTLSPGADARWRAEATYSRRLGPGSLSATASGDPAASDPLGLWLSFSTRLGREHSVRISARRRADSTPQTEVEVQRTRRGSDLGWAYRATVRPSGDGQANGSAALHRETRAFRASLEGSLREENADLLLRLEGAVAWLGGHLALARRIDRSFGLVEVPGQAGVEVLVQNRSVGRTDRRGLLVLPSLVPYQENRVQIDPTNLPIGLRFERLEQSVVPYDGGAVRVTFAGVSERNVRLKLVDAASLPVPAGSRVRDDGGGIDTRVARDGLVFLAGVPVGESAFQVDMGSRSCRFTLRIGQEVKPLENLGEQECR